MRLRHIKLSGFKSFVDPTTLNIPGNLTGIVGPNGCGKSNIIDAVTWVMGESSAKHLRGDSLTDVIFNGSNTRQPVGQASVELIFDNSEGKAGGQYASYNEISIKRQINRESISTYYLNGTRCRRRDITAIFLGTGLGPRSYSIIEQGMISRFIEARPEELRSFIEEAAGISKYRERRRETENRIRHTRENINRLTDIQEELAKQLGHLQRQARAAERYKVLKDEERKLTVETLALNWSALKKQSDRQGEVTRGHETRLEAGVAELRSIESSIEQKRQSLSEANDKFSEVQSLFYQIGGEISQMEQSLQHTREKIAATNMDLEQAKTQLREAEEQKQNDQKSLDELAGTLQQLEPKLKGSRSESDRAYELLNLAEQAMQSWQSEWDTFNDTFSEFNRSSQSNRTRLEILESSLEEDRERLQNLREEEDAFDDNELKQQVDVYTGKLEAAETSLREISDRFSKDQDDLRRMRDEFRELTDSADRKREELQKLNARYESLQALKAGASGTDNPSVREWLEANKLQEARPLAGELEMDPDWTGAIETVLADQLQSILVDNVDDYINRLEKLDGGRLGLLNRESHESYTGRGKGMLADRITSPASLKSLVAGIYTAESLKEALKIRGQLQANESVITRDGLWIGKDWVRIARTEDRESVIGRENEILRLEKEIGKLRESFEQLQAAVNTSNDKISNLEESLHGMHEEIQSRQQAVTEARAALLDAEGRVSQAESQQERIRDEIDELESTIDQHEQECRSLTQMIDQEQTTLQEYEQQKETLVRERDEFRQSLARARANWQESHEESHGVALQLESLSSRRASLEQAIRRSEIQIDHIRKRQADLERSLGELNEPVAGLEARLEARLQDKIQSEKRLAEQRASVQEIDSGLRELEQQRLQSEQKIQELRDEVEKARMAGQETRVRLRTIEEQLQESDHDLQAVLEQLDKDATIENWQEKLESVNRKIQRLGPINLAAIDEHSQLSERKEYLDSQQDDLGKALETLENAIKKIDKETKTRFKETFDDLNTNLQETFPVLFGGGNAYLELTSEDLLETGVTVMARPPGKRNTTIHLLSGGEKALTAVALVFSIFKLNPAPFCILDEVDAPLDDTNVGRFSEMVASMADSGDVQFIVITHNKITMEIAHQLLGVTMNEPGVSRIVSVDVDAAVDMAESA
ncbi:MAG: chromosome segregation protein SMC [Gammaproteobacteria bacterium]|nr:chromosome segregation protein SMC [Gammaproteobacteria bacterium]